MSTVIGIFERQFEKGRAITVVKPGTQSRQFTHVDDTINVCIEAWKNNKCKHYSVYAKEQHSIIEVAKMFDEKITYLPKRKGERFASALTSMNLNNKIYRRIGKKRLKDYILNITKKKKVCLKTLMKIFFYLFSSLINHFSSD